MTNPLEPNLIVCPSNNDVIEQLNSLIVGISQDAIKSRGYFKIALSGGSLASFLSNINDAFIKAGIDNPMYHCWYILLADERCVPYEHEDSNLGLLQTKFLSKTTIPMNQIYGIDVTLLNGSTENIAIDYEKKLNHVFELSSDHLLDLAVLGFGPDGHTCSLFPNHILLQENIKLIASIDNSPKPPSKRITMTYRVLNEMVRYIIFCGVGDSKAPILQNSFTNINEILKSIDNNNDGNTVQKLHANYISPPPFPCIMVQPESSLPDSMIDSRINWIVDKEAIKGKA